MKKRAAFKVLCRVVWSEDWAVVNGIWSWKKTHRFCFYDLRYDTVLKKYVEAFDPPVARWESVAEYRKNRREWFDTETEARFMAAVNGYDAYRFRNFELVESCTFGEFLRKAEKI